MEYHTVREIIHINADDYYASVVRMKDPLVRSRPVVVGYLSSRGSVVGASYEAREVGVRAGMTTVQARRLCPEAAFVQVDWDLFHRVSHAIFTLVDRYSPLVEPVRLDEGFVDYTGCSALFGHARDVAWRLQKEIAAQLRLPISLGLAANKLVSEVASRAAKRSGLIEVPSGEERRFLAEFPVRWLPGAGTVWAKTFDALGVKRIGTLAEIPEPLIERVFGSFGVTLAARARGIDHRPVLSGRNGRTAECIQACETFAEDIISAHQLDAHLYALAERVGRALRRCGQGAKQIRLQLTYTDGYGSTHTAHVKRLTALDRDIYREAEPLLERAFRRRVKVRTLTLSVPAAGPFMEQGDLFLLKRGKLASLYQACDTIRGKYGDGRTLRFGKTFTLLPSDTECETEDPWRSI
jgi:DNA polymerase-4